MVQPVREHDFSVVWIDYNWDNPDKTELGVVVGEDRMYDWAEADEVAQAFRNDHDGLTYKVGQLNHQGKVIIVDPPLSEVKELVQRMISGEYTYLSSSERKMLSWMFNKVLDAEIYESNTFSWLINQLEKVLNDGS